MKPESTHGAHRKKYVPVVGPRLKKLLAVVFGLFALLAVNSSYLLGVSILEWTRGQTYQNWFYLVMFLIHLILGGALILPVLGFGVSHIRNAYNRPNRRAVYVGYSLFSVALVLLASGVVLTRIEGVIVINDATIRSVAYWLHVITPIVAGWLFILHRLAGRRIKWKIGIRWAMVAALFAGGLLILQAQDPRSWDTAGPASGEEYFFPSLARTATGDFIPESVLMNDAYCKECHADSHRGWEVSAHRFSSFNNPPYLFSVRETRRVSLERDGVVQASRFCAGCHDPVVFFSGKFDNPNFDDVNDPTGQAGITCTSCHAITHLNSVRGNADYTIEEPIHYPFAFSRNPTLSWINRQLIKAKPEFHKKTFLKPLHKEAEFCATCHKVHLPQELNNYKFLRGQNHYDSYLLSGVSGHGVSSFYYPDKAIHNCNECHMKLESSEQFGARDFDDSGTSKIHDHQFPSANTGLPHLLGLPQWVIDKHKKFNEGIMRIDIFGIKDGGDLTSPLVAPLRPELPTLIPGRSYLIETVIRTVGMGHHFTQGTSDSNQVWVDVKATSGDRLIGRSGAIDSSGKVDPWSHFVNSYVLDRKGNRIDRRNAQDIFVPLYDHQIPPGAGEVVHFKFHVPEDARDAIEIEVRLLYRKFDTTYMKFVYGDDFVNDLPIMTLAEDRVVFPIAGSSTSTQSNSSTIPEWQRWNDYGIGLLRKGVRSRGELRQAEEAFRHVEALGRPEGPINLARVYLAQGTVQDAAIEALSRAANFQPPAPSWQVAWFSGLVNKQNGYLDEAIDSFRSIIELDDAETRARGFDFSQDYRLLNELGQTLFERAKQERGVVRQESRKEYLDQAADLFQQTLELDPENVAAHYNLDLIYKQLNLRDVAAQHFADYLKYKPDDNARDAAIATHRSTHPAADHAANAVVFYDLQRTDEFD